MKSTIFRCSSVVLALAGQLLASLPTHAEEPSAAAARIATEYVEAYYQQFPEEAWEIGYPRTPADRLGDRSVEAIAAWNAREDAWLAELRGLDASSIAGTRAATAYAFALDRLEAAREQRVCRLELWRLSPSVNGWQQMLVSTFAQQPVASAAERAAALTRVHAVPRYVDTQLANLRIGIAQGYLAAQASVDAVLRQLDGLIDGAIEDSPFYDPAMRSKDAAFAQALRAVVEGEVRPALQRYRAFLRDEYRSHARAEVGVAANPEGAACYRATLRFHTSLAPTPEAVHEAGLEEMQRIEAEMQAIARRSFDGRELQDVREELRSDPAQMYASEEALLAHVRASVERARKAVPRWFGYVPDARVELEPFPAYMKATGGAQYSVGSEDRTRPATYEVGTWQAQRIPRAGTEATAFHESYPGHHMQLSTALYREGVPPVLRYMYVNGMLEGWGLYAERLADEMGLYSSDTDRLGMLSAQAFRAARLVVDSGIHALGWSRAQAIDYLLQHTADTRSAITEEVDRYISWPGQATAYMTGSREILRLRRKAEQELGERFDIRAFHDRVLGDGAVSLPMLAADIDAWIAAQRVLMPAPRD